MNSMYCKCGINYQGHAKRYNTLQKSNMLTSVYVSYYKAVKHVKTGKVVKPMSVAHC